MRSGDDSAYGLLYRRHADAVRRYARGCCRDAHTAEDLTGEVFARTLQAVRGGSGPDVAVRAYLLTTVRRVAASWGNTAKREHLVDDFAVFAVTAAGSSTAAGATGAAADARAMQRADQSMAVRAFRSLPERWQAVLWHTAVERESPSEVAPLLGLTANATAVLAHRAREGLRQAYLQAHVSETLIGQEECGQYADRLGAYARGALRLRADRELRRHLDECSRCRAASVELADVNASLRAVLPTAFIGWFGAAYATSAAVAGAGAAAGAAGASAGGAAGGSAGGSAGGASGGSAAASEGLGLPAKVGIGAGAFVVAAGVALGAGLISDDGAPPMRARSKPPAVGPQVPLPPASSDPSTPGSANPAPEPPAAAPHRRAGSSPKPGRSGSTAPRPAPPTLGPAPKPTFTRPNPPQTHHPTPKPTPVPPSPPGPSKSPKPPKPRVFALNELKWSGEGGGGHEPTVRRGESSWMWQRHRMRVGGTSYAGGVSVHAPSSVTIDLNRSCASFDAMAGIDDLGLGLGAARFEVYGGGTRLFRSRVVEAGDEAVPVSVNLTGHRTVRLVARPAHLVELVDLADWADARITCR
ncbi:hypothetical protein GCM10012280_18720 [Wenjunlia tyrosinilytica]|uniref:Glycosyl hydrolase family 98 putative carbohydrate-binding module domain-containing protein n=1 Tax=Wenjunlia tyrosinilytica TaxID=1544741 RepID=A0A918DW95_9ACTN|nr:sigma-70 family RNA polymerase sigma factor [Wenjunlia tyrosinilytica]GGO85280.1 hypothetical protein GCM10012280_18720 [Wenjunlia tyrosinilytica]